MTSALRKKLLSLAIRGKLVPQDPADEPASVLLERIRAERESKESAAPRRGRGRRSSSDNPPCPKRGTSAGTASAEDEVFEPPFPIPESWVWTTLENVGRFISGKTPSKQELTNDPGIPYFKIAEMNRHGNDVWMAETDSYLVSEYSGPTFPAKSIVFPKNGGTVLTNKRRLLKYESVCDLNTGGVSLYDENLLDWVFLWFQTVDFSEHIFGGIIPTINASTVNSLCIPIPPISEQRAIVARFEELSSLCDSIDENAMTLDSLATKTKASVLDLAIRGDLVPQNPADEPASVLLDRIRSTADKPPCPKNGKKTEPIGISDPLFPIPESWEWTTLGEIGEVVRGTGIKRSDMSETGRPCVRYGEIYTTYSLKTEKVVSFVSEELFRSSKHVQARSVLMTLTGEDRKDIAKTIAYLGTEPIAISGDMLGICPREVEPLYLSFVLNSPWAIERKGKRATGDLVIHISQKSMSCFPVPLPPLAEQRRIVAKVEELFSAIDAMATK